MWELGRRTKQEKIYTTKKKKKPQEALPRGVRQGLPKR